MNYLQSKIKQAIDIVIKDRKVVAIAVGHLGSAPPYFACLQVEKLSGYGVTLCMNTGKDDNLRYLITDAVLSVITKE